ncbi:MAG: hypothetical protein Q9P01_07405 [Anaerolineae bacterium]|nr:hypothetical protein [Anaerolineae bacterium]
MLNTAIESRSQFDETDITFISGRDLTAADVGQPLLVLEENEILNGLGITTGDTITYNIVSGLYSLKFRANHL